MRQSASPPHCSWQKPPSPPPPVVDAVSVAEVGDEVGDAVVVALPAVALPVVVASLPSLPPSVASPVAATPEVALVDALVTWVAALAPVSVPPSSPAQALIEDVTTNATHSGITVRSCSSTSIALTNLVDSLVDSLVVVVMRSVRRVAASIELVVALHHSPRRVIP